MKKSTNRFGIPRAKELIPNNDVIVAEALETVRKKISSKHAENNFYDSLKLVMDAGYEIYLKHEEEAKKETVRIISKKYPDASKSRDAILFQSGIDFENSASQMRKSRAGGAFEMYVEKLLEYVGIPCEKASGIVGKSLNRTDRLVPSIKVATSQPDRAKFLSMKTTLAERWRQVIQEQKRGWAVYLVTLDEDISLRKAEEINDSGIVLFIKDELKSKKGFEKLNNVRRLSDLPDHLVQYKRK